MNITYTQNGDYLIPKDVYKRQVQHGGKLFVARSSQPLHIAVNGLQCLLFRHDPLQGLVGLSLIHI